jgi:hypothetical protein
MTVEIEKRSWKPLSSFGRSSRFGYWEVTVYADSNVVLNQWSGSKAEMTEMFFNMIERFSPCVVEINGTCWTKR